MLGEIESYIASHELATLNKPACSADQDSYKAGFSNGQTTKAVSNRISPRSAFLFVTVISPTERML